MKDFPAVLQAPARAPHELPFGALLVVSCPPPLVGQTLASALLIRQLRAANLRFEIVDLARPFHTGPRWLSYVSRARDVARLPVRAYKGGRRLKGSPVVFYIQIGQTTESMMRDLPLLLLARASGWPVVLHVHGNRFRSALEGLPGPLRRAMAAAARRASRGVVL